MRVRVISSVSFDALPGDIRTDIHFCVASQFPDMDEEDVLILLKNGPAVFPVVEVSPRRIWPGEDYCSTSRRVVGMFTMFYKRGIALPPVVIDRKRKEILCEGCHRTAAAVRAGLKTMEAIDVTGAKVARMGEPWPELETFDFELKRLSPQSHSLGALPPREAMKPLADIFQELAEARPGTPLVMLELGWTLPGWHPGTIPPMPVEEWLSYFRLAIDDPRLKPRARAKLTGPNFFWERDKAGVWNVMAYDHNLRIALPSFREEGLR